jgi:hypothetical protein
MSDCLLVLMNQGEERKAKKQMKETEEALRFIVQNLKTEELDRLFYMMDEEYVNTDILEEELQRRANTPEDGKEMIATFPTGRKEKVMVVEFPRNGELGMVGLDYSWGMSVHTFWEEGGVLSASSFMS